MIDVLPKVDDDVDQAPRHVTPGDHDRFAHYVPAHLRTDAMVFGFPLIALCGKEFVPAHDETRFPVCPDCKTRYDAKE